MSLLFYYPAYAIELFLFKLSNKHSNSPLSFFNYIPKL